MFAYVWIIELCDICIYVYMSVCVCPHAHTHMPGYMTASISKKKECS